MDDVSKLKEIVGPKEPEPEPEPPTVEREEAGTPPVSDDREV